MKKCSKCGVEKTYTEYGKSSETRDGLKRDCKECRRLDSAKRRRRNRPPHVVEREELKCQGLKRCTECKKVYPEDKFYVHPTRGRVAKCYYCKETSGRFERAELFAQGLRQCRVCREVLTLDNFVKCKDLSDGLSTRCRDCDFAYHHGRNPKRKRYVPRSEDERLEARRSSQRRAENKRRAVKVNALVAGMGEPSLEHLVRFYGRGCLVPGCETEIPTLDHIVPLAAGGKHTYENTQPLCLSHNSSKEARHHTDYRWEANVGNSKEGIILTNIIGIAA